MATRATTDFLAGVIEGFYGQPWTQAERGELLEWMSGWGLNTYLYAPKDDLKHRALWRELYTASEAEALGQVVQSCQERKIRFIYALSPGLDIQYGDETEIEQLGKRFEQMLGLGCRDFSLLFDDLPERTAAEEPRRGGSLASAQCRVANAMFQWVRARAPAARFLFCPAAYCGRMAARQVGGEDYLPTVGRELLAGIDVCWTGPEIISREITLDHVLELERVLRRRPIIWDNLHANDYDGRRFFCGPYSGRAPELRAVVGGLLSNPNNEFPLNYVPLRTLAQFVHCEGPWNAREAYLSAMREWLPRFTTAAGPVAEEDLVLLGDCYYLPHGEGPEAEALYARAEGLLAGDAAEPGDPTAAAVFRQQSARLRGLCGRLPELRCRPLFHALSRRIWELREELDLLEHCIDGQARNGQPSAPWRSDSHLPGTYRGGLVPRLQRLLVQQPDGSFTPAHGLAGPTPHDHRQPTTSAR